MALIYYRRAFNIIDNVKHPRRICAPPSYRGDIHAALGLCRVMKLMRGSNFIFNISRSTE